jgi:integrase/recombinase XerD
LWYENEVEPENWKNPIHKIKAPKLPEMILNPVDIQDVFFMVDTCKPNTILDFRDKAILLFLLDTGVRANELLNMNLADINLMNGSIIIQQGKGNKQRIVFLGKKSRKALRAYIKRRQDNNAYLWITDDVEKLEYPGLRKIIIRRAKLAGINPPSIHSFRRAFAINMLRAGVDVFSLQKLMGHADLKVMRRYLAQTTDDIAQAHRIGSPVDNQI